MHKNLAIGAVAALFVADVVFVGLAIRHTHSAPAPVSSVTSTSPSEQPSGVSNSSSALSSTTVAPAPAAAESDKSRALLAVSADGTVLRSRGGSCTSGGTVTVEFSTDKGATFKPISQPVSQVLRLSAQSLNDLWFVATDAKCLPTLYRSRDAGATWVGEPAAGSWYFSTDSASTQVFSPDGAVEVGCTPIAFSPLSAAQAYVGCTNGEVRTTKNRGAKWGVVGTLPNISAIAFTNATRGYALAGTADCPAAAFTSEDSGATWKQTACLAGTVPKAIDGVDSVIFAQVDNALQVSKDAAATWNLVS